MVECERAEFLASLGVDVAKLCDLCSSGVASRVDAPHQSCIALEEIKTHVAFNPNVMKNPVISNVAKIGEVHDTKVFTFEVRTTMGHYAIRSPTYANASETVREETGEPVLSVRKCSE